MKRHSIAVVLLLVSILLLIACRAVHKSPATPFVSPVYTVSPSTAESLLTPRQALEAMYGSEALSISDTEALLNAPVPSRTTAVHINLMACYWEEHAEKCLVITDSVFDNCHACKADIGGAVFRRANGTWQLAVFQPKIISLGSFGYVPKGELIQIGPDKHAALIRSGWAGQGYEGQYATIVAEIDGSFQVVLNLLISEMQETFAKDGTASLEWGYGSKMEFFAGKHPDFYDLVVTQYGINKEGNKFKTVRFYAFSDANCKYMLVRQR